jgi:hypothetical protein
MIPRKILSKLFLKNLKKFIPLLTPQFKGVGYTAWVKDRPKFPSPFFSQKQLWSQRRPKLGK